MPTALRISQSRSDKGFTLIELLVVILIIAILAAVAIPVLLNQRKKGWRTQSRSTLKNAATAQESFSTASRGEYTTSVDSLRAEGFLATNGVTISFSVTGGGAPSEGGYCIVATHARFVGSGDRWEVSSYDSSDGTPSSSDDCSPTGPVP